jgi:spore coat-associated protein N
VKKLILTSLAMVLALGMIGGAFAYFADTETSSGNTLTAGTMDMRIADRDEDPGHGVTATWVMSDMIPGETSFGPYSVNLDDIGTITADHLEISFSHSINDFPDVESDTNKSSLPEHLAKWLQITLMTYNGTNFVNIYNSNYPASDPNNNHIFDLDDVTKVPWSGDGGYLDSLTHVPPHTGYSSFTLELLFAADATDDIQGDTLTTTVTFTLNQDSSQ